MVCCSRELPVQEEEASSSSEDDSEATELGCVLSVSVLLSLTLVDPISVCDLFPLNCSCHFALLGKKLL